MRRYRLRRLVEIGWVSVSLLLVVFWARSVIQTRYQYPWEYWLRLPWYQKLQPLELRLERYFRDPLAPDEAIVPQIVEADLDRAMRSAADWLVSVQEDSGRFRYRYDPIRDEFSPPSEDSFHRQALSSYSLSLAYEMTGNHQYLDAARRSIDYFLRFRRTLDPDMTYFFAGDGADLGGAALGMLSMIKMRDITGSTTYDSDLKRLASFLIFLQDQYETEQFKSTYVYHGSYDIEAELEGWQSPLSPGQAMLALAWMHRDFHDPRYREHVDRALNFYSDSKYWKLPAFLPWTIPAIVSMYLETGEEGYTEYVNELADDLVSLQNLDPNDAVFGSFGSFPSIASTSFLEGLGDVLQLTQTNGDTAREARYRQRALIGYSWLLSLQYAEGQPAALTSAGRAIGGFPESATDPDIRIDYNAHAISALARGLRFAFRVEPAATSPGSRR